MRKFIRNALLMTSVLSFVCGIICIAFILYCEFFGFNKGNDFLKKINFPLNDNGIIIVCLICGAVLILSLFLRNKFFGA